jgi:hypothetical protein
MHDAIRDLQNQFGCPISLVSSFSYLKWTHDRGGFSFQ